jgi:type VI protein secretion system component Hcp
MRIVFFVSFLFSVTITSAQVGIGTNTPSANSVLDLSSANKGMMLPRINDTSNVSNPSAGLIIYNKAAGRPAFHNGTRWNTLADDNSSSLGNNDSITYTITNSSGGFTNGTFGISSISFGGINSGGPASWQDVSISKQADINSIAFIRAMAFFSPLPGMVIEFKMYEPGASVPYYSVKLTNCKFVSVTGSLSSAGDSRLAEQISITPVIFGFKDWVNNISFGYSRLTNTEVPY